ncbi:MAG: HAD-IA family hydrolase [Terracidiphilus sp.]
MASSPVASPVRLQCQGILFDMDGILISSVGSVERSWSKWARLRGIDPGYACRMAHGRRAIETVARLRPDLDSAAEVNVIEEIELADGEGMAVLPGVRELLAALCRKGETGVRWTVVTSASERLARRRLEWSGLALPERFVHAGCVREGKPHPAPFLAGAALLGFDPRQCVVFEDAPSGVQAGRAAGCTVVATTFSHSADALAGADYLIEDLTGVAVTFLPAGQGLQLEFTPLPAVSSPARDHSIRGTGR